MHAVAHATPHARTGLWPAVAMLGFLAGAGVSADSNLLLGKQIAELGTDQGVVACQLCHGPNGEGDAINGFPRIAGMDPGYLAEQLRALRDGRRTNPNMAALALYMTDADIAATAAYYASLPIPDTRTQPPVDDALKRALDLVRYGDWTGRGIPACSQCHGPDGNGIGAAFPPLAGQHASYIKSQFESWDAGTRHGGPLGMMAAIAARLSSADVEALASYYAAQPSRPATPARGPGDHAQAAVAAGQDHPTHEGDLPHHGPAEVPRLAGSAGYFRPPSRDSLSSDPMSDAIALGEAIFESTNTHPASAPYVGNAQACGNCHLDAGRLAEASPLWAAWVSYPAYRTKNKKVNTFIERIQGCFEYSMNAQASAAGGPPAADSDPIVALVAYSYWLASGAPTGDERMPGRGFGRLTPPAEGFDARRGARVFAEHCAICHGADGQGVVDAAGNILFPPLWGAWAYNWGAGMHRVDTAAAFIKHNMPLGLRGSLSDQDAWDVAAFMNSHERPQDPRFDGSVERTAKTFHAGRYSLYGKPGPDGAILGSQPTTR